MLACPLLFPVFVYVVFRAGCLTMWPDRRRGDRGRRFVPKQMSLPAAIPPWSFSTGCSTTPLSRRRLTGLRGKEKSLSRGFELHLSVTERRRRPSQVVIRGAADV